MSSATQSIRNAIKAALPTSLRTKITAWRDEQKAKRKAAAVAWCDSEAITLKAALETLTGSAQQTSFYEREAALYKEAEARAEACPVEMGGAGNLELVYQLAKLDTVRTVVETGVAYGWSSLALLAALKDTPDARLVSTDRPYPGRDNKEYVGVVVPESIAAPWDLKFGLDQVLLPAVLEEIGELDMCHYDSDKRYEGRMWAYPLLWEALRPGGLFVSDDIADNFAFRDFAKQIGKQPMVIEKHDPHQAGMYVGVIVKD